MWRMLLFVLAVAAVYLSLPAAEHAKKTITTMPAPKIILFSPYENFQMSVDADSELREMLRTEAPNLNLPVIDKVVTILKCANENNVDHNHILTLIDYSLPASEKRLWVFDLKARKLLFHTYVSHGIKSGILSSEYFSNKFNSKASSIGVYKTEKTYYGRHGLSLKLDGLDDGFNDNAANRSVVMHGGWYVDEDFVKKYGRAGRSWGCPAVPENLKQAIIDTIKDNSLFVVYYPNDNWLLKSKFLKCNAVGSEQTPQSMDVSAVINNENERDEVFFADVHNKKKGVVDQPIAVMQADDYERIFHVKAPLTRMLRKQINNTEYVAINDAELKNLTIHQHDALTNSQEQMDINRISFVEPVIIMVRGYYATEMKLVDLGKIKEVTMNTDNSNSQISVYTVHFDAHSPVNLHVTNRFIRWLGL
jgi:hypothetical protein